jgi:hypothetical protein
MENKSNLIQPLLQHAELYGNTSIELLKLKLLDKAAGILSRLIFRFFLIFAFTFFTISLNIGIALWMGDLLGKNYYGFLVVAAFYGLVSIIYYILHPMIKTRLNNAIISQILN